MSQQDPSHDVTLSLWDQRSLIFVNGELPDAVARECIEACRYRAKDFDRTTAWKRGEWDGYIELFRKTRSSGKYAFPVGLLSKVSKILDLNGITYEVDGLSRPGRGPIEYDWDSDIELRDYQDEAVAEALQRGSGVISAPMGSGKTICGIRLVYELQHRAVITLHLKEVAEQWADELESILNVRVGRYFDGNRETDAPVVVALYQSMLDENGNIRDDAPTDREVFIADEVHSVGADSFSEAAMSISAPYRFGLSATPKRKNDNAWLKVVGGTGPLIADLSPESLIDRGILAEPVWEFIEPPRSRSNYRDWQAEYDGEIVHNDARNDMIARTAEKADKPCIITVERKEHGERLESLIEGDVTFIHGSHPDRDDSITDLKNGDLDILISTRQIIGEGFNCPNLRSFIVAGGMSSPTATIQQVGRALRGATSTGTIYDFIDQGYYTGQHSESRIREYREYFGDKYGP